MAANTLTIDDAIATEVKGLKAAYKNALGVGKKIKKTKAKRKDKQASQVDTEEILVDTREAVEDLSVVPPIPEATRPIIQSHEGKLAIPTEGYLIRF